VRLFVVKETAKSMDVIVKCEGLKAGRRYVVGRAPSCSANSAAFASFEATGTVYAFRETIDKTKAAVYRCWGR